MEKIKILGGVPLIGDIEISGAKNAALPIIAASLLTDQKVTLSNVPNLADTRFLLNLCSELVASFIKNEDQTVEISCTNITNTRAPYELVKKMRASFLVFGPLLAREGRAEVSLPGGCVIGSRPVDCHIDGLMKLGASIELQDGYLCARCDKGLRGADIHMSIPSVTGTENIMMAATLAKGTTRIFNAAKEPEIVDLANMLKKMGAKITGDGTNEILIEGVDNLSGCSHSIIPDRLEIGTYAIAAAITRGNINIHPFEITHLKKVMDFLEITGVKVSYRNSTLNIDARDSEIIGTYIETEVFPGFPTDLQAQWMALMCTGVGESIINETVFENRFMHVPELRRMGANIEINNRMAKIKGVKKLKGANVMATDLRASSSLVLAGLSAEGETTIDRIYHLDRGYENLEKKLRNCGAQIIRRSDKNEESSEESNEEPQAA